MNEERAREILAKAIQPDGSLYDPGHYLNWNKGSGEVTLDASFAIEELEAIAWWVSNQQAKP